MPTPWSFVLLLAAALGTVHTDAPALRSSQSKAQAPSSTVLECPWLTRETAADLLGGGVSLTAALLKNDLGSCLFRRQNNRGQMLEIDISRMRPKECRRSGSSLKGIANWAKECSISRSRSRLMESIVGQARDRYFTITLRSRVKSGRQARSAAFEKAAELVAGNLY